MKGCEESLVIMSRQNFKTLEHLSVMKLPTELQALQRHEHLRLTHDHLPDTENVDWVRI